jgi:hypothetical protein
MKLHSKFSESVTSGMNRGTPYAGSAIEADDKKKSRPRRSRNCYTHFANEREEQSRHSNERRIYRGEKISNRLWVITWGDEGARRPGGAPARNADPGGGAAGAGVRRDSGRGVGSGARVRSPRAGVPVPVSVAWRASLAEHTCLPASHSCPAASAVVRLVWTGLDWTLDSLPAAHCRFSPLHTSPPLLLPPPFFPFGISPPPPAAGLARRVAGGASPARARWAVAALRLARFGNAARLSALALPLYEWWRWW